MRSEVESDVQVVQLTAEAADTAFDAIAQREMGISGVEFLARWDRGEWTGADFDKVPGLVDVWMSLPMVR